jgi:hypothetical protein
MKINQNFLYCLFCYIYCTVALKEFTPHMFGEILGMTNYSLERMNSVYRINRFFHTMNSEDFAL